MKKYLIIIILGLAVALVISIRRIRVLNNTPFTQEITIDISYDTTIIKTPIYISSKPIDTIYVPIGDTLRLRDTLYQILPRTQKYYAKDSLYRVWVSGYQPKLDSLYLFPKTTTSTITNTIRVNPSRWSIGLSVGYGLSLSTPIKFTPYIGASLNYSIIQF